MADYSQDENHSKDTPKLHRNPITIPNEKQIESARDEEPSWRKVLHRASIYSCLVVLIALWLERRFMLFDPSWLPYALALPCAPIWIVDTSFTLVEFSKAIRRRLFNRHE